jgi:uncharacterized membrane protein YgcG
MKILAALGTALVVLTLNLAPALARDQYVVDNAHLFSAAALAATNARITDFAATTGKEVFVYTTPSLDGDNVDSAAERVFAQQQVNGVMIFISKSPKKIGVYPDRASRTFFPAGTTGSIRDAIAASFNTGNFDQGLQNGVSLTINLYRSHLPARTSYNPNSPVVRHVAGGFSMGWIFFFLIIVVAFLVLRALFRALFAPRVAPPMGGPYGMNAGGPMGGPGYGYGPGMGMGGMGMGMGGGGFWSGLLGGLGGAWLGNEIFGGHNNLGGNFGGAGFGGTDAGSGDQSGFQSDPGQIDTGNASSGDWGGGAGGDSGGGWGGGDGGGFGGGGDGGGGGGW